MHLFHFIFSKSSHGFKTTKYFLPTSKKKKKEAQKQAIEEQRSIDRHVAFSPRPSHLIAEDDKLLHRLLSSFFFISPHSSFPLLSVTPSLPFSPFNCCVDTAPGYLFCKAWAQVKWAHIRVRYLFDDVLSSFYFILRIGFKTLV